MRRAVLILLFLGCNVESGLDRHREAVVEPDPIFMRYEGLTGDVTTDGREKLLVGTVIRAQLGPGQGSLVTRCLDGVLCNVVTVDIARPAGEGVGDAGVRIQGTWQIGFIGPDGRPWRGELMVRQDPASNDAIVTKVENLETLTGSSANNAASMLPISELTCQIPSGCNPDLAPPPPEGGTWICVPVCRLCVPTSDKICL